MQEQHMSMASMEWPRLEPVRSAPAALLAGAIATGVLLDLAVRSGVAALGAAATVWAIVWVVVAVRRTRNPWALACFAGAAVLAVWLVVRASPWLAQPDLLAIALLLAVGSLLGADGSPFDLHWSTLGLRSVALLLRLVWMPSWMLQPAAALAGRVMRPGRADAMALARGAAIAVPIVLVLGLLLGSADPVFASFFNIDLGASQGELMVDLFLVTTGAALVGAIACGLSITHRAQVDLPLRLGGREALVVMVAIDALFALFALAQADAALGGAADALRRAGVTYADYARSGFFQLLWVAGLTWLVAVVARDAVPVEPGATRFALIAAIELAIGLVLLIVYVAHVRLQLYETAYGFTMLRLYSHVFAGVVAAAFVLVGVSVADAGQSRSWLFGAVTALLLVVLIGLNAASPEALVARLNIERAQQTGKLDADYLASLSDDATALMLAAVPSLRAGQGRALRSAVCAARPSTGTGWESFDIATRTGEDARGRDCRR
jgi:hypothetical protein